MSNKMPATNTCAHCGSLDVYLQRQPARINKDGSVASYTLECRECGKIAFWRLSDYGKSGFIYPAIETPVKTPFEGLDKKELDEISTALGLLLEHPVTRKYLIQMQEDLCAALGKEKA